MLASLPCQHGRGAPRHFLLVEHLWEISVSRGPQFERRLWFSYLRLDKPCFTFGGFHWNAPREIFVEVK